MRQLSARIAATLFALGSFGTAAGHAAGTKHDSPAKVEAIDGTDVKRITLTEKAAERIGITLASIAEETARRNRKIGGEVVQLGPASDGSGNVAGTIVVKYAPLLDAKCSQSIRILPIDEYDWSRAVDANMVPALQLASLQERATHYAFVGDPGFAQLGSRLFAEVCMPETERVMRVVPHAALLFTSDGRTWVYVAEGSNAFVRSEVELAWISGDRAFLTNGPLPGTPVAVGGSVELFGEEFGIGH
jgi:hypothetical protein